MQPLNEFVHEMTGIGLFLFQTIQAKAAIERQQAKIRALIEEQADMVEAERAAIEKRAGEQVRAAREETSRQVQEATRLEMELEKQVLADHQTCTKNDIMNEARPCFCGCRFEWRETCASG